MRLVLSLALSVMALPVLAAEFPVERRQIDDLKAVIATVEPGRLLTARARIGGIVEQLKTKEGQAVETGAEIALVADQKLLLQVRGLDQRIRSQQATRDQARADAIEIATAAQAMSGGVVAIHAAPH